MSPLLLIPDITMPTPVYFTPHALAVGAHERGCFTYQTFQGELSGNHVVCRQEAKLRVIGDARIGCAF